MVVLQSIPWSVVNESILLSVVRPRTDDLIYMKEICAIRTLHIYIKDAIAWSMCGTYHSCTFDMADVRDGSGDVAIERGKHDHDDGPRWSDPTKTSRAVFCNREVPNQLIFLMMAVFARGKQFGVTCYTV
jgi:hypothetical protein